MHPEEEKINNHKPRTVDSLLQKRKGHTVKEPDLCNTSHEDDSMILLQRINNVALNLDLLQNSYTELVEQFRKYFEKYPPGS